MPLSENLRAYEHVRVILDHAIAHGGARYTRQNHRDAVRWRLEAYQFRKLFMKSVAKDGVVPPTPYDGMHLVIEGAVIIIRFRTREELYKGSLSDLQGKPIDPTVSIEGQEADDIFTEQARELRAKLTGEVEGNDT